MSQRTGLYIDGAWVTPTGSDQLDVVNPATEAVIGHISLGSADDVNRAVAAARTAFPTFAASSRQSRLDLLERVIEAYQARADELAKAVSAEMGAPITLAKRAQVPSGAAHLQTAHSVLENFEFASDLGRSRVVKEPVGVCGLITPWNWPLNQIACKVAPALAVGCTMVLKPSELAPLSANLFADVLHDAGVPAGVFNLVQGTGSTVGAAIAGHPDIDMVSFTGSTRGGIAVAKNAADTVKRVTQELGGKSANIVLADADLAKAVRNGVQRCLQNSGQSCNAPTRLLIPAALHDDAVAIARQVASDFVAGDPADPATTLGPLANVAQFDKVRSLIDQALADGAELVCGGSELPATVARGYYVQPTIFANVSNDMRIARDEVFGPVLVIIPYADEDQAVDIANDTVYGLSGAVFAGHIDDARRVAGRLRTGMVHINGAALDTHAPFGGYKQSGNGREWGAYGFEDFLEAKSLFGYADA
ncbi:MAG: aldehyde dehydrogenase family protein [Pseudomonadota bacterium]